TPYYLFVIHEYWGLNDYVKQQSERLSNELGMNVLALDLYDGKVTSNHDSAAKLMQSVDNNRAINIIKGAYSYAGSNAKVFTLGWCFGGGWSLQAALLGGSQIKGCVMYYGMPEKDVARLKTLNCDVIGFFGKKDQWINPEVVKQFEENMKAAGKKVTTFEYDANHAFANPSNPVYNKEATADANAKASAFIKERI
ncbi:MAG: dienelactone hydrolase family protein, partial [Bacteroidota bacterium]|nr:dienelactone hydrolase family protein [Bacteroidota bacterium]